MTTTIRAEVGRTISSFAIQPHQRWCASAWAEDTNTGHVSRQLWEYCSTWHEAMEAAQRLRGRIEQRLTDEMHESLATRRAERAAQLEAEQQPVPTSICIWCRQLGHPIQECPSWRAITEVTR